jgi:hypothetical protein
VPAAEHSRAHSACPTNGHLHWLRGMVRQTPGHRELEPSAECRSWQCRRFVRSGPSTEADGRPGRREALGGRRDE